MVKQTCGSLSIISSKDNKNGKTSLVQAHPCLWQSSTLAHSPLQTGRFVCSVLNNTSFQVVLWNPWTGDVSSDVICSLDSWPNSVQWCCLRDSQRDHSRSCTDHGRGGLAQDQGLEEQKLSWYRNEKAEQICTKIFFSKPSTFCLNLAKSHNSCFLGTFQNHS